MERSKDSGPKPDTLVHSGDLYPVQLTTQLTWGICVGVRIPTLAEIAALAGIETRNPLAVSWPIPRSGLSDGERTRAGELRGYRRPDYIAGRVALRAALARLGVDPPTIGCSERGAPLLPAGYVGSISHKRPLAIGVARPADGWTLGVDLEVRKPTASDISSRILTDAELSQLGALGADDLAPSGLPRALEVILRFSIKEAIYKAIDPFVQRYVGFREVEVYPRADGQVTVHPYLDPPAPKALTIRARWTRLDEFFVSSAGARLA